MRMENQTIGKKIIILGCPGSGKSTLARQLQIKTGLPLFHLDNVWWKEDRTHISREEFDQKLEEIISKEKWILDGDYSRTYEVRFRACDTVIFLDYSEEECMSGIKDRIGKDRGDIPWIDEQLDPKLVEQVKNYQDKNRPMVYRLIGMYADKEIHIFKTRKEAQEWVSGL